ncbi:hypothetical protein AB1484_27680 [Parafrankia sp. FMc6]|uniref:hypothetical protein n=1 Tax=Parafrankia soli TaxID=2599596 RepID=UPI0034D4A5CD
MTQIAPLDLPAGITPEQATRAAATIRRMNPDPDEQVLILAALGLDHLATMEAL